MDAKDYLLKIDKICSDYDKNGICSKCPLRKYGCGSPKKNTDIDHVLDIVEHYEERTYPFGRCDSCGKEFNSELTEEYNIKYCPYCGQKLDWD